MSHRASDFPRGEEEEEDTGPTSALRHTSLLIPPRRRRSAVDKYAAATEDLGEPCCSCPAGTHCVPDGEYLHQARQREDRRGGKPAR